MVYQSTLDHAEKVERSIAQMRLAAGMSKRYYDAPLLVCYSGGKDSDVLVELALMSGIDFEVQHSRTTVDAPETIDAIHANLERENESMKAELDRARGEWDYWENTHVELPKDADDVHIFAGDKLDGYGKTIEVVELRYGRSGWVLISRDGNAYADTFAFTHHHAPTVEDVLREFANEVYADADNEIRDRDFLCAKYAKRLTLAGDAE